MKGDFSAIDRILNEAAKATPTPAPEPATIMGQLSGFWLDLVWFIDSIPATTIFFLTATALMLVFSVPLWRKLNR